MEQPERVEESFCPYKIIDKSLTRHVDPVHSWNLTRREAWRFSMRKTLAALFGIGSLVLAVSAGILAANSYTPAPPATCPFAGSVERSCPYAGAAGGRKCPAGGEIAVRAADRV
jgi:hypothetical protein